MRRHMSKRAISSRVILKVKNKSNFFLEKCLIPIHNFFPQYNHESNYKQSEKTRENCVDGKNQEDLEHLCAKLHQVPFI